MWLALIAMASCGLGAAIYISLVEHPVRLALGAEMAVRQFRPSYQRASVMQASLAVIGCVTGLVSAWQLDDRRLAVAALALGAVVPLTLIVIKPTNAQRLNPAFDPRDPRAAGLLAQWGRLHAIRGALSVIAFLIFLWSLTIF